METLLSIINIFTQDVVKNFFPNLQHTYIILQQNKTAYFLCPMTMFMLEIYFAPHVFSRYQLTTVLQWIASRIRPSGVQACASVLLVDTHVSTHTHRQTDTLHRGICATYSESESVPTYWHLTYNASNKNTYSKIISTGCKVNLRHKVIINILAK